MSDERDSQLSAMYDGELPSAECELVARRVARDDLLRSQWARYAIVGAALRREEGVALDNRIALRVRARLSAESVLGNESTVPPARSRMRAKWRRPATGLAIAATVAAISVLALQGRDVLAPAVVADATAPSPVTAASSGIEPESYVVPAINDSARLVAPAQLATYVVAHSEVSMPLSRRNLLTSLIASEPAADAADFEAAMVEVSRDGDAVR